MSEDEFSNLIDKNKYRVFFFACKMSIPFSFTIHTWVVVVDHGKVNRYDIWGYKHRCETSWGYLHLNLYKPWIGVRKLPSYKSTPGARRFKGQIIYNLEGEEGSLAERVVIFLNTRAQTYPYINKYHYFPGPNSNTFTQWIIDKFPELEFRLPWTAIGKNALLRA